MELFTKYELMKHIDETCIDRGDKNKHLLQALTIQALALKLQAS